MLTSFAAVVPWLWFRAVMLLTPLLLLNLLSIGTVMSDTLANIADHLPLDASFTGRTDIWTFGVQAAQSKLATGYGFAAFWGFVLFSETPDLATVVGTLLIAGAGLLVVRPPTAAVRRPAAKTTG